MTVPERSRPGTVTVVVVDVNSLEGVVAADVSVSEVAGCSS